MLVEVPHAGLGLPAEVRGLLAVNAEAVRRDADAWVDALYRDAPAHGATLVAAELSRYVVDLNRAEGDVDEWAVTGAGSVGGEHPRGVVWRESGEGRAALRRPLTRQEFEERLERYHRPYHRALAAELARLRGEHRDVVLLAAHSMPSTGKTARGDTIRRADVVPGTRAKSTAARPLIDAVEQHFRAAGLSVRHDDPYRGGATTARWGRVHEGFHAVQVELNRDLYMDEESGDPKPERFAWLSGVCMGLVDRLTAVLDAGVLRR